MCGEALSRRKRWLRADAKRLVTPDPPGVERAVRDRVLALSEVERAGTVSLYCAAAHEVSIDAVLTALLGRGVRAALPRVEGDALVLHEVSSPRELSPGYREIREPAPDAPLVPTEEVDVFLVPGVLFDRAGGATRQRERPLRSVAAGRTLGRDAGRPLSLRAARRGRPDGAA